MMRKWLLVETVAPLQEEDRPRAVELDERGDEDEQRRRQKQPRRGEHQIERAFLNDFAARQRPARQLKTGHRT